MEGTKCYNVSQICKKKCHVKKSLSKISVSVHFTIILSLYIPHTVKHNKRTNLKDLRIYQQDRRHTLKLSKNKCDITVFTDWVVKQYMWFFKNVKKKNSLWIGEIEESFMEEIGIDLISEEAEI